MAQVHGKRHSQHQLVDRDDETVHDHDSRFKRTRREDPSPTLRCMGIEHSNDLRQYYSPVLRLLLGAHTRTTRSYTGSHGTIRRVARTTRHHQGI
jgi:hypothetical protein